MPGLGQRWPGPPGPRGRPARPRTWLALLLVAGGLPAAPQDRPFGVRVVDAATGRGVPLVELRTTHALEFVTDSNGLAAIDEPALRDQSVFFHVRSHGYEFPADGFGNRGFRCRVRPGTIHRVELPRHNVAERLYRVTGAGIYRDSVRCGVPVPIRAPLLNGGVTGQDSVVNAIFRGKLYWFWGDTNRLSYPLGNFAVSGATSVLPRDGGLPPERGVDLTYFVDAAGFSRPMCKLPGPGPVWISGLMVVDDQGQQQLLAHYARMKDLGTRHEHGIVRYDPQAERFVKLREFPLTVELHPTGNPTRVATADGDWFYFPNPYPAVRVRARLADILDPRSYQAYSCLPAGADRPERRAGHLVWRWRRGGRPVTPRRLAELTGGAQGSWMGLRDVATGTPIVGHGGTVHWNAYRGKWVMIALQSSGRSMLGEVWYAEADTLQGPWGYARRIVTHDRYSFYNVKHHEYFDQDDGRRIQFEGTYTATFSGNHHRTPRYDYNQVMYRLDLADPRLRLPAPVYEVTGEPRPLPGGTITRRGLWSKVQRVAFWATTDGATFQFADAAQATATVAVHAWESATGDRRLRTADDGPGDGWRRVDPPLGRAYPPPLVTPPVLPGCRER